MPFVDTGQLSLYYESHGSGPPLLLIAGLASDSPSWQPVVGTLAERFRTIVFDNRGSGRSRPMDEFVSIGGMADDALLLLDHLGIGAAHLLGHSMGGFIAQEMALRQPERVRSLVLAATACRPSCANNALFARWADGRARGDNPEEWFRALFSWLFTGRFLAEPEGVRGALDAALGYPYPQSSLAFANQVRAMAAFDRSRNLPEITCPALVLAGDEDILFPPETAGMLARLLPAARQVTIRKAAHAIHLEQPGEFCRAVREFLEETARSPVTG